MRTCPSLVLILSLAACEHASTATSPSTLPEETAPAPAPEAKLVPPPPAPEAKTVAPTDCSEPVRQTRAAVKWKEGCEPARVTKKQPTMPNTGTPAPAEPTP